MELEFVDLKLPWLLVGGKLMAINRADYQYSRNTLPLQQSTISDNTLKIGSAVKNLLPELVDDSILEKKRIGWELQNGWI